MNGRVLMPGFIDAHTHLAWLCTPCEFLKHTILWTKGKHHTSRLR
ncbi:MAG: hypothetical protein JRH18_16225 [Deltaproteobacteria bacterium]|nr:hypothetical protein [Deltaproteobacteria bacterium]MBW2153204.1 hypothetical protein [Deltaproteobacteria bacterium]